MSLNFIQLVQNHIHSLVSKKENLWKISFLTEVKTTNIHRGSDSKSWERFMLCTLSIVCHTGYMMRVQYSSGECCQWACCIHKHKEETGASCGVKRSNDGCCIHGDKDYMLHSSSASICNGTQDHSSMWGGSLTQCWLWSMEQALFHYHLYSQFTSCFSRELKGTVWSPNWCKDVFTFMKQRTRRQHSMQTSWSQGRVPAFVLALWAGCVHISVFTVLPQAAAVLSAVCVWRRFERNKKLWHDIWGSRWQNVSHGKETKGPSVWLVYSPCWSRTRMLTFFFLPLSPGSLKFCSVTSPSSSLQSDSSESDVSLSPDSLSSTSATSWGHGDKITRLVKDALKAAKWRETD